MKVERSNNMNENNAIKITVCTQNVKNKFDFIMNQKKLNYYDCINGQVKNILDDVKIDIMGLQEITEKRLSRLKNTVKDGYHLYKGKGRMDHFPSIISYNCIYRAYNEYNSIIARDKFELVSSTTHVLPWLKDVKNQLLGGAIMPRIASVYILKSKDVERINVINTHLDYNSLIVQEEQLKKLTTILRKLNGPIIMMGDFNMFPDNPLFAQYRTIWEQEFQLKMVVLPDILEDQRTWIGKEGNRPKENAPYDYIFGTPELKMTFSTTMDYTNEQNTNIKLHTDHKAMVAEFEIESHNQR